MLKLLKSITKKFEKHQLDIVRLQCRPKLNASLIPLTKNACHARVAVWGAKGGKRVCNPLSQSLSPFPNVKACLELKSKIIVAISFMKT